MTFPTGPFACQPQSQLWSMTQLQHPLATKQPVHGCIEDMPIHDPEASLPILFWLKKLKQPCNSAPGPLSLRPGVFLPAQRPARPHTPHVCGGGTMDLDLTVDLEVVLKSMTSHLKSDTILIIKLACNHFFPKCPLPFIFMNLHMMCLSIFLCFLVTIFLFK